MIEKTFIIIKPDGVARGLVGTVLSRFEARGFRILRLEVRQIGRELARQHYAHISHLDCFEDVLRAITAGPCVLCVLERESAISVARNLIGATDPAKAQPGTIRGDFGTALPDNVVHASDSPESYRREVGLFFPDAPELQ